MLTAANGEAIRTLLALLKDSMPPSIRLGTSRAILENSVSFRQDAELEQRMAAMEMRLGENNPPPFPPASP